MMLRISSWLGLWIVVAALSEADPALAAEPPSSTDEELFRQLIGDDDLLSPESPAAEKPSETEPAQPQQPMPTESAEPDGDAEAEAIAEILVNMATAERRLKDAQTDKLTLSSQDLAIEELGKLIEEAKQQKAARSQRSPDQNSNSQSSSQPKPKPNQSPSDPAPQPAGTSDNGSDGSARTNSNDNAEESSDRPLEERQPSQNLFQLRSDLVRESWGHLPPRLRDQLLNADSDQNLPQYDSLVRKYFESLAQPDPTRRPDLKR